MSCSSVALPRPNRSMKPARSSAGWGAAWGGCSSTRASSPSPTWLLPSRPRSGLDFIDLGDVLIDPSAVALVPGAVCRRHMLVPVRFVEGKLVIAMADPANVIALDDVRTIAQVDLKPVVSTRGDVMAAIARAYRAGDELDSLSSAIEVRNPEEEDLSRIKEVVEEAPDRQVRQPAHHPGDPGRRLRHPHRAHGTRPAGPVPHRRGPARGDALTEVDPVRGDQPPEDHGRDQHRRATHPAGRPAVGECLRPQDRPARGHPADGVGREGRHAHPGQLDGHARPARTSASPGATSIATGPATSSPTG